jgi:flagellar L-ring protein precursor FlgH
VLLLALSVGVSSAADKPAKVKPAEYETLYARYLETARLTAPGATSQRWVDGLFLDPRARSANDLLTVRVVESINAAGSADSTVNKSSTGALGIGKLFGVENKLPSATDPASLVSAGSDTKFKGSGSTTRNGVVTTNITVRVAEVLPNGDLVLEGAREIDINGDRQMLVLTGVVRPADISPGNVVLSTAIGQLRVQYFGHGLIKDSLSPGWLI